MLVGGRCAVLLVVALLGLLAGSAGAAGTQRVVVGSDGYLFIAQDWTVACQDSGSAERVAAATRDLVRALESGGRRAVVVVGPDKSTVQRRNVPRTHVPARACGEASRAASWRALTAAPGFLDLRPGLARAARGPLLPYWRKDTHWSPTGGAVYARALAQRLDPELARRLTSRRGTSSRDGDLARDLGRPDGETLVAEQVVNPDVVETDQGYWLFGGSQPALVSSATPLPGGRVLPGRTVVVGDSFTGTAYDSLRPLFAEGVFFHPGYAQDDLGPVLRQLEHADTVVIQVVERFVQRYRMFEADAVAGVRRLPHRRDVVTAPGQPIGVPCGCAVPPTVAGQLEDVPGKGLSAAPTGG